MSRVGGQPLGRTSSAGSPRPSRASRTPCSLHPITRAWFLPPVNLLWPLWRGRPLGSGPQGWVGGLRLVRGRPCGRGEQRGLYKDASLAPSPLPGGLSFLLACSPLPPSLPGCSVGWSPNICPRWAQEGEKAANPGQGSKELVEWGN